MLRSQGEWRRGLVAVDWDCDSDSDTGSEAELLKDACGANEPAV